MSEERLECPRCGADVYVTVTAELNERWEAHARYRFVVLDEHWPIDCGTCGKVYTPGEAARMAMTAERMAQREHDATR